MVISLITVVLTLIIPTVVTADEEVRGVHLRQKGLKVIEEKCLVCHNTKVIDQAVRNRRDIAQIIARMKQKGANLSADERQVMGHFWQQSPLKEEIINEPKMH